MITDDDLKDVAKKQKIPLREIFMKDMPPKHIHEGGYIVNLQDKSLGLGGSHWISIYFPKDPKNYIMYMDSFGFIPPASIINWVRFNGGKYSNTKIIYNDRQIQNERSGGCGIYSLFFIDFINRHQRNIKSELLMEKWNNLWSTDVKDNLAKLKEYTGYYKNSDV